MNMRLSIRASIAAAMLLVTRVAGAQSAAEHIAAGDKAYVARDLLGALHHYEEAIAADSSNVEALWKASNAAVDLGEFNDAERQSYYSKGEQLGRLAVKANPQSANAHFALAKALGRVALSLGKRDKVKYARVVHDEAEAALDHPLLLRSAIRRGHRDGRRPARHDARARRGAACGRDV